MTAWEKKIIDAFISHYFASASETGTHRKSLRLISSHFFPDFETTHTDEKESYLEAAESLERKGLIKLNWEKRNKGERLKTLTCENFEMLFAQAGRQYPQTEAEHIRAMLNDKINALKDTKVTENVIALLEFLALHLNPREIGQGIDQQTMEEFIRFLEFSCEPARLENITIRALSILLYRDSKRLEELLSLCKPLITRSQKNIPFFDLAVPQRSYPETGIAGKIAFEYNNINVPMVNAGGHIVILPLETVQEIMYIHTVSAQNEKTVLTIENKETFYALGSPQKSNASEILSRFDCFLYTGGYPSSAASILIKTLSASGFSFYHAGDLDPDGILILQHIQELAQKPVTPLRMDTATFDQYRAWARPLDKSSLRQIKKISEEVKAVPNLAGLLWRIEETGLGVEQEIIDYR